MLDPVQGFFSGLGSGLGRYLLGFAAVLAGALVCVLPLGWEKGHDLFSILGLASVGMVFYWAFFGVWWFVGLLSMVGMLAAIWAYAQEIYSRRTWFAAFSLASLYHLPLSWSVPYRWEWAVLLYGLVSAVYWLGPPGWVRWQAVQAGRAARAEMDATG